MEMKEVCETNFPISQVEQKSIIVLLEMSILQWCKTICKTWWFGWPSLSCQRTLILSHEFTINFLVLLHGFTLEFTELEKQQEVEPNEGWWN